MLIRVVYKNNKYDLVTSFQLDELIASGRVKKFLRSDGWATIGVATMRGNDGRYNGMERRNNSKYSMAQ